MQNIPEVQLVSYSRGERTKAAMDSKLNPQGERGRMLTRKQKKAAGNKLQVAGRNRLPVQKSDEKEGWASAFCDSSYSTRRGKERAKEIAGMLEQEGWNRTPERMGLLSPTGRRNSPEVEKINQQLLAAIPFRESRR